MTLLEVVLAVVLLALIASAALSTVTLCITLSLDDQKTLAAHEVAHKLILQYLDNKKAMPSPALPIEYGAGRFTFRYRFDETPMEMRTKAREVKGGAAELRPDRFRLLTVRIYDGVDTGGGGRVGQGDEIAVMTRMMDPIAINRNPNALKTTIGSPDGIRTILESFGGGAGATQTPAQAAPRPGRRGRGAGAASAPAAERGASRRSGRNQ